VRAAHTLGGDVLPQVTAIQLDGPIVLFALLLAAATGVFTGLLPALQGSATTPRLALRTDAAAGPARDWARAGPLSTRKPVLTAMADWSARD
jgi:hypothetical protein